MRKTALLMILILISAHAFTISPSNLPSRLTQAVNEINESGLIAEVKDKINETLNTTPIRTHKEALKRTANGVVKKIRNRTRERKVPKVIVPPKVKKFIDENREKIRSADPQVREQIKQEIKQVVKKAKLGFAVEIYKNCTDWSMDGVEILRRVETKNHLFLLVNASTDILPQMVEDECLIRLADKDGLKVFLRQAKKELIKERREKIRELKLKNKRGLTDYTEVTEKIEEEAPETPPPSTEGYNVTSDERLSYQNYVTPDDSVVQANKKNTPEENYLYAVSWVWISDPDLTGESEKWFSPHDFLTTTASMSSNPTGRIASDCSEQANTLVSLLRASGVSANDVKVVLGLVDFDGNVAGHAWVEFKQTDGTWLPLESTSGSGYIDGELVESTGAPFDYWKTHEYPVKERWVEYNDIFFVDYKTGKTNAPSEWSTTILAGPDTALSFPGELPTAELDPTQNTDLYCKYASQLIHAEKTSITMQAIITYLESNEITKASLINYLNSFKSEMQKAQEAAQSNNRAAYDSANESAKNFASAFKSELQVVIDENSLDTAEIRAAVNSALGAQSAYLEGLDTSKFKHCKLTSLRRFTQYIENLRDDADTFAELDCGIQDLEPIVETVATYEAYLENYMDAGHEEGLEDIEEQITGLQQQLKNAAQVCHRNRLATHHNKLIELSNQLVQKGVDVSEINTELNEAAQLINNNQVIEGTQKLNSVRARMMQIAGGVR